MKTASVQELKKELRELDNSKLVELCLRLARYKKENKEILTYLLFEAQDLESYTASVKGLIDLEFGELPKSRLFLTRKSVSKILRLTNKYIRFTGSKQSETELLLYFCNRLMQSGVPVHRSAALYNLFVQQVKKIEIALSSLHEDLQYDYSQQLQALMSNASLRH